MRLYLNFAIFLKKHYDIYKPPIFLQQKFKKSSKI